MLCWGSGLVVFEGYIQSLQNTPNEQMARRAEAIVVLTGGNERLKEGLDLLRDENYASRLYISGVGQGVTIDDVFFAAGYSEEDVIKYQTQVTLGDAKDTYENAQEIAQWTLTHQFDTVRLVTSNYHMPRSLLELRSRLPKIEIIPHVVSPKHVRLDQWWYYPGTRDLIISEYHKYIGATIRSLVKK